MWNIGTRAMVGGLEKSAVQEPPLITLRYSEEATGYPWLRDWLTGGIPTCIPGGNM